MCLVCVCFRREPLKIMNIYPIYIKWAKLFPSLTQQSVFWVVVFFCQISIARWMKEGSSVEICTHLAKSWPEMKDWEMPAGKCHLSWRWTGGENLWTLNVKRVTTCRCCFTGSCRFCWSWFKWNSIIYVMCLAQTRLGYYQFLCQWTFFSKSMTYHFLCVFLLHFHLIPKTFLQKFYFPFSEVKGKHLAVPRFVWTSAWSPTDGSLWACDTYLTFFFFTLRGCCWAASLM